MSPAGQPRLEQGDYKHSPCPDCVEPAPLRTVLATDTQVVTRRRWCGGVLVDFHLAVQTEDAQGWRNVVRFSMAHSNFHRVQYSWDPRRRRYIVIMLIDREEQVEEAYLAAVSQTYSELETFLDIWKGTTG